MATVTPNFNWPVPTSTDLVKDGATAIEAFGDSIDASLVDLKGGTTGQVLSKASNTDMDFTWVTDAAGDITGVTAGTGISGGGTSGTVTVTNSMATAIDAKGDLVPGTGADTFARLAVGANGTVLTADSAEATGMKWAAAAGGGKVLQVIYGSTTTVVGSSSSTFVDTTLTATITPSSASSKVLVLVNQNGAYKNSGNSQNALAIKLLRGSTDLAFMGTLINYTDSTMLLISQGGSLSVLDTPATTSATTYKTQFRSQNGAAAVEIQSGAGGTSVSSTIVLMEIGA
jgi:hypothetical protein